MIMKKKVIVGILALVVVIGVGYYFLQNNSSYFTLDKSGEVIDPANYLGSDHEGNYVWGGAMNLAWTELSQNIIEDEIRLDTEDPVALDMMEKLNNTHFSQNDLDEESYYVKSGYGQKTVDEINRESKKKFPSKSFEDLAFELQSQDVIAYAYFLKEVEYAEKFDEDTHYFKDERVKTFYAETNDQKENVEILKYWDDDKFIIRLKLKDETDEIIVAKGFEMETPVEVINEIREYDKKRLKHLNEEDYFEMPKLHLDMRRDYTELRGLFFMNSGFEDFVIYQMYENIKFDMDEVGARVENEAVIVMDLISEDSGGSRKTPRYFVLDEPFWVVMKQRDSQNPYFILGVNNTELMEKV